MGAERGLKIQGWTERARELLKRGGGLKTPEGTGENGKKSFAIWRHPSPGSYHHPSETTVFSGPAFQDIPSHMALTTTDSICFLCVCLCCTTEKIELPNSTSTEVEMTPSSDASEPVQNGNLSHTVEAADAQVRLSPLALDVLAPAARTFHSPRRRTLPGRADSGQSWFSLCLWLSTGKGRHVHQAL